MNEISILIYKIINKNIIALDRDRTDDLVVNSHTLVPTELQGQKKMREAGFEPAHPEIRRLKRRGIDQLTDSRNHYSHITVTNIFVFLFSQFRFLYIFFLRFYIKSGPNNASKTAPSHCAHCLFSCAAPHNIHNSFL